MQQTRFNNFQKSIGTNLSSSILGPWNRRSIGIITLLIGYYLGSNLTVYFLQKVGQRPLVVISMVLFIEILIRLRSTVKSSTWPIYWLAIDNMRIGSVYAVVLEAFKLGS